MPGSLARILKLTGAAVAVIVIAVFIFDVASIATPPAMTSRTSLVLWLLAAPSAVAVFMASLSRRKLDPTATVLASSLLLSAGGYQYNLIRVAHEQKTNIW